MAQRSSGTSPTADRRKEELEKKRQKVQELRRARQEKSKNALLADLQKADKEVSSVTRRERKDVDDLISSLVGERVSPVPMSVTATSTETPTPKEPAKELSRSAETPMPQQALERPIPKLTEVDVVMLDIPPRLPTVYNKEIQTATSSFDEQPPDEDEIRSRVQAELEKDERERLARLEEERKAREAREERAKEEKAKKELSEEQRKRLLTSGEFLDFLNDSTKLVERALNEPYDFMKDYTAGLDTDIVTQTGVKLQCSFFDDRWSKGRDVTDVAWSSKHAELLVSSYSKNPNAINEPDGVVCVWNLHLLERPEFVFHTTSDVLCTTFAPFHPNLVVGGTYSGQIVLWDTRSRHLPVLKTPLSAAGHTHPVYSLKVVGSHNAHNLVTASTDGLVCSWQLDMLAQPQEMIELVNPANSRTDEVAPTVIGFPDNETGSFWVGTEEGTVWQASRYDRAGAKAGINANDTYRAHAGPVTGLDFHPLFGPADFSDLFLTSSFDWTVKMWRAKPPSKHSNVPTIISPIGSFEEASDYVYDVKWSTSHPAVFGTVDGGGRFDVWNLNQDTEVPIASTVVGPGGPCNKLAWDREGRRAAVGSGDGTVYVFDVGEISQPRQEEWTNFQKLVYRMSNSPEKVGK